MMPQITGNYQYKNVNIDLIIVYACLPPLFTTVKAVCLSYTLASVNVATSKNTVMHHLMTGIHSETGVLR